MGLLTTFSIASVEKSIDTFIVVIKLVVTEEKKFDPSLTEKFRKLWTSRKIRFLAQESKKRLFVGKWFRLHLKLFWKRSSRLQLRSNRSSILENWRLNKFESTFRKIRTTEFLLPEPNSTSSIRFIFSKGCNPWTNDLRLLLWKKMFGPRDKPFL